MSRLGLVLLLLGSLAGVAAAQEGAPDGMALHFADIGATQNAYNFTTFPPAANATGTRIQFVSTGTSALLEWRTDALPEDWNVTTKTVARAFLFLSGLDEVFPYPPQDPERVATTAGRLEIRIEVVDGSLDPLLDGSVLFQPQHLDPREDVFAFEFPLRGLREATLSPRDSSDYVQVFVHVSGRNLTQTNISPVHFHLGGPDTDARLELEGFPYAAFRAWEEQERATRERNEGILRGVQPPPTTTEPPTTTTPSGEARQTSFVSPIVVLFLVLALARKVQH